MTIDQYLHFDSGRTGSFRTITRREHCTVGAASVAIWTVLSEDSCVASTSSSITASFSNPRTISAVVVGVNFTYMRAFEHLRNLHVFMFAVCPRFHVSMVPCSELFVVFVS